MDEVVRAAGLVGFRRLVRELGGNPSAILGAVGLDEAALDDPDLYIPYRKVLLAFEKAAQMLDIPDFGMRLAARQGLDFLGMLALAIQSAASVREGLLVAARNMRYHTPSVAIDIAALPATPLEQVRFRFMLKNPPVVPQATEHAVTHLCKLVARLSENRLTPAAVYFRHAAISPIARYADALGTVPQFDSAIDGIALHMASSRQPLPRANSQMQIFIERILIGAAPSFDLPIDDQVRETISNFIRFQKVGLADVARVLRLHPRALQRRLQSIGVSFETLHDEVRREQAASLLSQSSVPLAIVAGTLGFCDQAAFNRACRRWFNAPPGAVRRSLR